MSKLAAAMLAFGLVLAACTGGGAPDSAPTGPGGTAAAGPAGAEATASTGPTEGRTGPSGPTITSPGTPAARCYAVMTDAPRDAGVLLFGGFDNSGPPGAFLPHVWGFAPGEGWTQLSAGTDAEPGDLFAYDLDTDRAVFFEVEGALWSFDPAVGGWEELEARSPALHGARMVYDSRSDRLVVFGGDAFTPTKFDETWTLDLETGAWSKMDPKRHPPGRSFFAMAYDEASDRIVVFGGYGDGDVELDDTWTYDVDTETWELLSRHGGPGPRGYTAMGDDPTGDRVILFGGAEGVSEEPQGDTWALDVGTGEWTELDPASAPSPRAWHVMATDAETRQVVVFGGGPTRNECTAETWVFDPRDDTWSQVT